MAKLGMAGRRKRFFIGLLSLFQTRAGFVWLFVFVFFFVMGWGFPVTGPDDPLQVQCEVETENLEAGRPFSLTLTVNHGETLEVTIIPPDFRDKFRLEAQRTSTRLVRDETRGSGIERWSVFAFTLVPLEAGAHRISPFGIRVREQIVWTSSFFLTIAPTRAAAAPPVFRWETPLPALKVGEWSVFRLLVTDATALSKDVLRRLRFSPPPEAIVESAALDPETPWNAAVIELRVLPMRTGTFILDASDFEAEAPDIMRLHIPELRATIR